MPSPKQPLRASHASPSRGTTAAPSTMRRGSPDARVQPAADIELDPMGPATGRPRRRSSLLRGTNGRTRQPSLSKLPAAPRIPERSRGSGGDGDGDAWDDAWDNDDNTGAGAGTGNGTTAFLDADDPLHDDGETGLSPSERRQRADSARWQRHHTWRLDGPSDFAFGDGRLHGGGGSGEGDDGDDDPVNGLLMATITADERKEADKAVLRRLLINGTLIGLWYLFSLSISLYNKWMFGSNFPFPLFTTSIHMLVQFLLSCLVLYFLPWLRPGASRRQRKEVQGGHGRGGDDEEGAEEDGEDSTDGYKLTRGSSQHGPDDESVAKAGQAKMSTWFYLTRIGPCGAATGLDIGLGNASLKLITLTFYTMCKSSSLAFVLLFAFAFRLETPTLRLVAIIAAMTVGVVMMVAGEVEFDPYGFFLVISAAFFSGFRWGLTQILLLRNPATSNPFSSIFYLAPVMFATLFVLAVPMEGFRELVAGLRTLAVDFGAVRTPLLILFPGTIAFLMTASEFALLQRTSVVTLSIAGIFKEVVTITTATLVFHDTLTLVNLLGLVLTMAAIAVYNYIKITRMRQQAQINVHQEHHHRHSSGSGTNHLGSRHRGSSGSSRSRSRSRSSHGRHRMSLDDASVPPMEEPGHSNDNDAEAEADSENAGLLRKVPAQAGQIDLAPRDVLFPQER
ncbi:hypothetical protein SPI_00800 [Niveomyces insectorum RCEF 264]|uniref:Sugar phosphate transporter domain-containing protein n=1 Tax=Niveomyces insectorum RCEF 264 TaxID=1081102 RepID=A0A168ADL3_9HYPO|nr:hypothetical protein SPI_00800 [Niveomyces insectorum RCEF 264]